MSDIDIFEQDLTVRQVNQQIVVDSKLDDVIVKSKDNQNLLLNQPSRDVSVVLGGPPGPPGKTGPPGSNGAAISYVHTQITLASSWVINHNLGFYPNVTVEDADTGRVIMGSEIHHSLNQMELQFNSPRAGIARLS